MPDLIEPNLHPLVVHFVIALFFVGPFCLLASVIAPLNEPWRNSLRNAGDWMIWIGAAFAVVAVAAGLYAYNTVAHDEPSHIAMTNHRNWALATATFLVVLAIYRWIRRRAQPGALFLVAAFAALTLVGVTGWKGGRLVYHYGLGVKSLPQSEGPGHHHHHHGEGAGHEHGAAGDEDAHAEDGHEHGGADADHDEADGHAHANGEEAHEHGASEPANTGAAQAPSSSGPAGVVDSFHAAMARGDTAALERFLTPDAVIAEGGGAERSFKEYASAHMPADIAFTKALSSKVEKRDVIPGEDVAVVITQSQQHGTFRDKQIDSRLMETAVLKRTGDTWRIAHLHWSSSPITGEHEH